MDGNGSAATAMLGLAGFVLLAVSELGGEVEQAVETTERVVGCPGCGVLARLHDRRPVRVRDLPAAGRAVTLIWVKRVWRCVESVCAVQTWTERSEAIRPRASLTERARREACRRVGQDGHTVAQVAGQLGVGWATVMTAVAEYGYPLVDDPARLHGVTVLGVDETGVPWCRPAPVDKLRDRHRGPVLTDRPTAGRGARPIRQGPIAVGESAIRSVARADHRRRARPISGIRHRPHRELASSGPGVGLLPRHPTGFRRRR